MLKLFQDNLTGITWQIATAPKLLSSFTLKPACAGVLVFLSMASPSVQAFGFGEVRVSSELGQPLRATVSVTGNNITPQTGACFTAHVKASNGALIADPSMIVTPTRHGASLAFATAERMSEPVVSLVVENNCGNTIRREFALLLEPPISRSVRSTDSASTIDRLALPGPFTNALQTPRSDDRLRRFLLARQADDARRTILTSQPDAALALQRQNSGMIRNALHMGSPIEANDGMMKVSGLRLAFADRLTTAAPDKNVTTTTPPEEAKKSTQQSVARDDAVKTRTDDGMTGQLLGILGGVLVVSLGIIALLRGRVKHQKQAAVIWDWDENDEEGKFDREPTLPKEVVAHAPAPDAVPASTLATPAPKPKESGLALDPMVFGPIQRYGTYATMPMSPSPAPAPVVVPLLPPTEQARHPMSTGNAPGWAPGGERHDDLHFPELPVASTGLEEISDVMEEAEFWISLKNPKRAAEVLEPYANVEAPGSPLPWLYLFDLYRELESREQYDTLRERFHQVFNARILTWEDQARSETLVSEQSIDDVPHVKSKITSLWQSEEIVPYLNSLLVDDRYGTRAGFTLPVYREIMFLIGLASVARSEDAPRTDVPRIGTWTIEA